jgi:hypothetical protein
MSTRRLFAGFAASTPASPYVYLAPRRRRWPLVAALAVGTLGGLALVGPRLQFPGAGAAQQSNALPQPHWSVPASGSAATAVAKSDRLHPEAAMASVPGDAPATASATAGESTAAASTVPAPVSANAAEPAPRHVARKPVHHARKKALARHNTTDRYGNAAWNFGAFGNSRSGSWFSGVN